jgi:hypothetical protein
LWTPMVATREGTGAMLSTRSTSAAVRARAVPR